MRVVIALGGNALLEAGQVMDVDLQRANLRRAAEAIADIAREHEVIVTHGNGPQVGLLALQAASYGDAPVPPLDVLGAESEGMVGYLLEQVLATAMPGRDVVTLLTQVEVAPLDPAFDRPDKPIGPLYDADEAQRLARQRGWSMAEEDAGYRRVVPSPAPRRILEIATIRVLLEAGRVVVCAGGGGIPVIVTPAGAIRGVEAVMDKDRSSALLANDLDADALLLLTDVPAVFEDWPRPCEQPLGETRAGELRKRSFEPGSMGPKVEAACRFVVHGGSFAAIGALEDAGRLLRRDAGTIVLP